MAVVWRVDDFIVCMPRCARDRGVSVHDYKCRRWSRSRCRRSGCRSGPVARRWHGISQREGARRIRRHTLEVVDRRVRHCVVAIPALPATPMFAPACQLDQHRKRLETECLILIVTTISQKIITKMWYHRGHVRVGPGHVS
jgi:hypothetical protein